MAQATPLGEPNAPPAAHYWFVSLDQTPLEPFDESPSQAIDGAAAMNAVLINYERWKEGHSGGSFSLLFAAYAPTAEISIPSHRPLHRSDLESEMTSQGTLQWRFDIAAPQECTFSEGQVFVSTLMAYAKPTERSFHIVNCRTVWRNIDEEWFIVREDWLPYPTLKSGSRGEAAPPPPMERNQAATFRGQDTSTDNPEFLERVAASSPSQSTEVLKQYELWRVDYSQHDLRFLSFYAPEAQIVLPTGAVYGLDYLRYCYPVLFARIAAVNAQQPHVAIAYGEADLRVLNEFRGTSATTIGTTCLIWRQQKGVWRIIRHYASYDMRPAPS